MITIVWKAALFFAAVVLVGFNAPAAFAERAGVADDISVSRAANVPVVGYVQVAESGEKKEKGRFWKRLKKGLKRGYKKLTGPTADQKLLDDLRSQHSENETKVETYCFNAVDDALCDVAAYKKRKLEEAMTCVNARIQESGICARKRLQDRNYICAPIRECYVGG